MMISLEGKSMDINSSLLRDAIQYGIINLEELEEKLYMTQREKVLEIHNKQIRQRKDGRFETYVGIGKERKSLTSTTEHGLYEKLYSYYFGFSEHMSLETLYPIWLNERMSLVQKGGLVLGSVKRNQEHWNKYLKDTTIIRKPIKDITLAEMDEFWDDIVLKYRMTRKEYTNVKFIFSDMYILALKKQVITINIMRDVTLSVKCKTARKKAPQERVYLSRDYDSMIEHLTTSNDIYDKAILFQFQTGLRIGEIVSLKWSDFNFNTNHVSICRENVVNFEMGNDGKIHQKGRKIIEMVKSDSPAGYRTIPLTNKALSVLHSIEQTSEYVFACDGKVISYNYYHTKLEKVCKKIGIDYKSSHALRRTNASRLSHSGMPIQMISTILGHTDIETTKGYIYDVSEDMEKRNMMNLAL